MFLKSLCCPGCSFFLGTLEGSKGCVIISKFPTGGLSFNGLFCISGVVLRVAALGIFRCACMYTTPTSGDFSRGILLSLTWSFLIGFRGLICLDWI